jgi:hypothetical protein
MFGDFKTPPRWNEGVPHALGIPIPPSNPQILNIDKEIFIQNDITLLLDVW